MLFRSQVRENVDFVADALGEAGRKDWVGQLSSVYHVHRIFYLLVAAAVLAWTWRILLSPMKSEQIPMKSGRGSQLSKVRGVRLFTFLTVGTLLSEIGLGISMHKLGIPPMLQPLHLLFATVLFASAYTLTGILYLKSAVK